MIENKQLKSAGLKITAPWLKILQALEQASDHHLSAENVYKKLSALGEEVSLATIYRVLTQFEAAGLIERHNFAGGYSVFELRRDPHHDHLVCVKCGHIEEFMDDIIETRQHQIANKAQFKMTGHALNIYGICAKC